MQATQVNRTENSLGAVNPFQNNSSQSLWEDVSCNLCGSRSSKVKYQGTTDPDTQKLLTSYKIGRAHV